MNKGMEIQTSPDTFSMIKSLFNTWQIWIKKMKALGQHLFILYYEKDIVKEICLDFELL